MSEFIGFSKVKVDDQFLDQVVASRRESQRTASQETGSANEILEENSILAREQARRFVLSYFSLGREND